MRRGRPVQDIRVWNIQDRSKDPRIGKPFIIRWIVDGAPHSASWPTRPQADRYRSRLLVARQDGEWFDRHTGEPESWRPAGDEMQVYAWARQWVAGEWQDWAPRTRRSAIEALARFLPLVVDPIAPDAPAGIRAYLTRVLRPDAVPDDLDESERWLQRWGLALGDLSGEMLAEVEQRLALGVNGQQLASETAGRYRKVAHSCVRRAVELGRLHSDPWPPAPRGRRHRKARRRRKAIDIRRLPDPLTMTEIIKAIPSHQPGSRKYQVMTAATYYAGLRPSEVVMLRPRALRLPDEGWGLIHFVEADDGWDEPADPKTGERWVPIPPVLVGLLRSWIKEHDLGPDDLLFRTRTGRRPAESNWGRTLKRACAIVGFRPLCPYDARHACATTMLRAGVSLGEAALRLGHSVETLVSYYVGALQGDDVVANERIDSALRLIEQQRILCDTLTWLLSVLWTTPGQAVVRRPDRLGCLTGDT